MPTQQARKRAVQAKKQGKAATTQAGEYVREEMHELHQGKSGIKNPKQAIAIGLSEARSAGVKVPSPKPGQTSDRTRQQAQRDVKAGASKKASKEKGAARKSVAKKTASRTPTAKKATPKKSTTKKASTKKKAAPKKLVPKQLARKKS